MWCSFRPEESKVASPCVFLKTSKTTLLYNECLKVLITYGSELGFRLNPLIIMTDFEMAVIKLAIKYAYPG